MSPSSPTPWYRSWSLPLISSVLVLIVMYGMVPYTFKYSVQEPVTIFHMLWLFWSGMEDWQHGMLVVPISLFLLYWKREKYLSIPVAGDSRCWPIFVLGFLLYVIGYKGDIKPFAFSSIQIMIAGLVIWHCGWPMFKAAFFPWIFLTFAWPMPGLDGLVAFPLRELMSAFTHNFLNLIGIPSVRIGTAVVSAPDVMAGLREGQRFALDVADPCSGIRSLFALTMVTAIYGYISLSKTWQKITLFLCSMPLAVFGNFIRMLMLTFGTMLLGPDIAIGTAEKPSTYHEMAGFVVFIAAIIGMLFLCYLFELDWKKVFDDLKKWAATPALAKERKNS